MSSDISCIRVGRHAWSHVHTDATGGSNLCESATGRGMNTPSQRGRRGMANPARTFRIVDSVHAMFMRRRRTDTHAFPLRSACSSITSVAYEDNDGGIGFIGGTLPAATCHVRFGLSETIDSRQIVFLVLFALSFPCLKRTLVCLYRLPAHKVSPLLQSSLNRRSFDDVWSRFLKMSRPRLNQSVFFALLQPCLFGY